MNSNPTMCQLIGDNKSVNIDRVYKINRLWLYNPALAI